MVLLFLAFLDAAAFPGVLVGPSGSEIHSTASMVVVSQPSEGAVITIAVHVQTDAQSLGFVLPVPEPVDPLDVVVLNPDYLRDFEVFSAPRLEQIRCEDLSEVTYFPVGPGCGSFEIDVPELKTTADAVASLPLEGDFAPVDFAVDVVPDAVGWLEDAGFAPESATALALQASADGGAHFVVVRVDLDTAPTDGTWLEPLQVPLGTWGSALPLSLSAPNVTAHDLTLLTVAAGPLEPAVYEPAVVERDCMVRGDFGAAYEARLTAGLSSAGEPAWALEFSGLSSQCSLCTRPPLEAYNLGDVGVASAEAQITRWRHRYDPASPAVDLLLVDGGPSDDQMRYLAYDEDLEFAYPVCGRGWVSPPGVCPDLRPEGRDEAGCDVSASAGWIWLLMVPLLLRRRQKAALAWLLLIPAMPARAAPAPPIDLFVDVPLASTARVLPQEGASGLPRALSPLLGGEGRIGVAQLKKMNIGLTAGLRGFRGRVRDGDLRFSFTEPHAGVDARHGAANDGATVAPLFRYGLQASIGILDSAVFTPKATMGALLHVGAGAAIGTSPRRLLVELRASTVPRTDAYVVSFHPVTNLPGWTYYPGSMNVTILLGLGFE